MADEATKREEDRINRTLNNIGKRTARPVSWNVDFDPISASTPGLSGTVGSIGRNTNAAAIKSIQEQIREEERRQQFLQGHSQPHPQPQSHSQQQQHAPQVHHSTAGSGLGDVEDEAEKERKMRVEEERLERWMKKGDSRFEELKGVDARQRSVSLGSAAEHIAANPTFGSNKLTELAVKFQDQVYQAAKALRQKKSDDVVKHSFNAAITAKAIAETLSDDAEIFGLARALEAGVSTMRTSVDSGGDGLQYYTEVAGYLGQLFVSTIGAI